MNNSWVVLLPPIFVLTCAAFTHNVIASLLLGIAVAAFIAADFSGIGTLLLTKDTLISKALHLDNAYLFGFLILLGFMIEMMTHSGGITAYTRLLRRYVHNKRDAETTSLLLSIVFFIDDFMNGLTVGAIMRPLTDSMHIPRIKLAYLINAVSSPLCVLIPATTWVAMILGQLQETGLSDKAGDNPLIFADPLYTYFYTMPFIFYAPFMIIAAWFVVRRNISFGLMYQQEQIAQETGNLFGGKPPRHAHVPVQEGKGTIAGFFIPIGTFIGSMFFLLFYSGDAALLGGTNSLIEALKNASTFWSLFTASFIACAVSMLYFLQQKQLTVGDIMKNAYDGLVLTKGSIFLLYFAYVFSSLLTNNLEAGAYLAHLIAGILPLFILPSAIFVTSTAIAASIGSSWSTIAVMLPLVLHMLIALTGGVPPVMVGLVPQFYATLGALLAGSIAGAHFSPITDSMVMASTATGCYHMDHVQTQITYSIPALIGTFISFLILGALGNYPTFFTYSAACISGLVFMLGMFIVRNQNK